MPTDDDEMVALSALQHYLFCPRQCALIHVEGQWEESYLTASGRAMHERVDCRGGATRRDVHTATALKLFSRRLGVTGVADLVEFHRADEEGLAIPLPRLSGRWMPCPVEYKRGKPKSHRADEVQLCAQGICLEEMLGTRISGGVLFYGVTKRRMEVAFDAELRSLTESVATAVRELVRGGTTPPPVYSRSCEACSLQGICRPKDLNGRISARHWLQNQLEEAQ